MQLPVVIKKQDKKIFHMEIDLNKLFQGKFEQRTYRSQFNIERFTGFEVKYMDSDLWIGIDPASFRPAMKDVAFEKIKNLRHKLDDYIKEEPFFKKSLKPISTG